MARRVRARRPHQSQRSTPGAQQIRTKLGLRLDPQPKRVGKLTGQADGIELSLGWCHPKILRTLELEDSPSQRDRTELVGVAC